MFCGSTILVCIVLISVFRLGKFLEQYNSVLLFETIAVEAFGFAWLTKGEAIFKDEKIPDTPRLPEAERASSVGSARA